MEEADPISNGTPIDDDDNENPRSSGSLPEDENMEEYDSIAYANDDGTFEALSLYFDYEFEPSKIRDDEEDDNYEEDSLLATSNSGHPDQKVPFCEFIDGEPGISSVGPEILSPTQRVLKNVLIPVLHEYLENYSMVENNQENFNEDQKAEEAENCATLLETLNSELLLDRKSWRLRSEFAVECLKLCRDRKVTAEQVNHIICCFALTFMDDSIDEVRISGAELLAEIFSIFIEKEWPSMMLEDAGDSIEEGSILDSMPLTKALLNDGRKGFLNSNSWRRRQTWANVLKALSYRISKVHYCTIFLMDVYAVAHDKIRNIRRKFLQIFESLLQHRLDEMPIDELFPSIYMSCQKLTKNMAKFDPDFEIQNQAQIVLGHLDPLVDYLDYNGFLKERQLQLMKD